MSKLRELVAVDLFEEFTLPQEPCLDTDSWTSIGDKARAYYLRVAKGVAERVMDYLEKTGECCETCCYWDRKREMVRQDSFLKCPCGKGHGDHGDRYWCRDWEKLSHV